MLHVVERREHDHRDQHRGSVGAQPAADIEAVDVGKHQVQQHDVGKPLLGHPQRGLAVFGDHRVNRAHAEDAGDEIRLLWMVFHDEGHTRHADPRRSKTCSFCWGTALLEFSTILTRKRPIGRISSLRLRDV